MKLKHHAIVVGLLAVIGATGTAAERVGRLKVSENQRYLVTENSQPFFWLGDTAWELFHRLNRDEADRYLKDRAEKGYTVIQAVALAELDGLHAPNAYGHKPLIENDPTKPDVKEGPANDYWDHVDYVVRKANSMGMVVGFLPTWGDKWNKKWGQGPEVFTPDHAEAYGTWLGNRYKNDDLVWILGGDRPIETDHHREIIRRMAIGLRKGDDGVHLQTFHPTGGNGSAEYFHDSDWLDFNMRQNGHVAEFSGRYEATRVDYDRKPVKPVLDGEPIYEDHPVSFDANKLGHSIASDVRRPLYWNLFTGAMGHTYGHHSVWQMWTPDRPPINHPLMPWYDAIQQPGASQMQHGKHLMLSRPFLQRIPDDSLIVPDRVVTSVPGAGRYRFVATRDLEGTYAMVYAPVGRSFQVRTEALKAKDLTAWWFNPRDGQANRIGTFRKEAIHTFTPPNPGEMLDWVLVLDDAAKQYPPPGAH